jgi:hypothetical protein
LIDSDDEGPSPEVRAPMADNLDPTDQLPFIGAQFGVLRREMPAKERHRPTALVKHCASTPDASHSAMKS